MFDVLDTCGSGWSSLGFVYIHVPANPSWYLCMHTTHIHACTNTIHTVFNIFYKNMRYVSSFLSKENLVGNTAARPHSRHVLCTCIDMCVCTNIFEHTYTVKTYRASWTWESNEVSSAHSCKHTHTSMPTLLLLLISSWDTLNKYSNRRPAIMPYMCQTGDCIFKYTVHTSVNDTCYFSEASQYNNGWFHMMSKCMLVRTQEVIFPVFYRDLSNATCRKAWLVHHMSLIGQCVGLPESPTSTPSRGAPCEPWSPYMVCVLPLPVWPYAKTVTL